MPIEPPRTSWNFPPIERDDDELIAIGADLEPGTVLWAYRHGIFPMPIDIGSHIEDLGEDAPDVIDGRAIGWWSPDPRGILPLDGLRVSRSLRRSMRRYDVTFDTDFDDVVRACADPSRDGGWIDERIAAAYGELHRLGWTHSVEVRDPTDGSLVGGLYGVHIDGLFAGESMFHRETDASKVALVALVDHLRAIGVLLLDVQWVTPHLSTLGAIAIPRPEYLDRLRTAIHTEVPTFGVRP